MAYFGAVYGDTDGGVHDVAGDQTLIGDDNVLSNALFGDADFIVPGAVGGDDTLIGGDDTYSNLLVGDADRMWATSVAGDDVLIGGSDTNPDDSVSVRNTLIGDVMGGTVCQFLGDDLLIGGDYAVNYLYGDAEVLTGSAIGGDDILVSGSFGRDIMWGDGRIINPLVVGGHDTFVFGPNNGDDTIMDFRSGEDVIDLGLLVTNRVLDRMSAEARDHLSQQAADLLHDMFDEGVTFDVLDSNGNGTLDDLDAFITVADGDTVIDLGAAQGGPAGEHTVEVLDNTALTEADFSFDFYL